MPPANEVHAQKRIAATKEAAAAFVEDMAHIRDVLARTDPVRGEIRRLSAILRRLIVDNEISLLAAPRIGKFNFEAPDNTAIYESEKKRPLTFFGSGGVIAFGNYMRAAMVEPGDKPRSLPDFHPEQAIYLRLDKFQSQRVLCLNGKWASRSNAISYIANVASGIHSGPARTPEEILLSRIKRSATYSVKDGTTHIAFNLDAAMLDDEEFSYTPNAIDPILLELLATAKSLATSFDTSRLETAIRGELGIQPYLPEAAKPYVIPPQRLKPGTLAKAKERFLQRRAERDAKKLPTITPAGRIRDFRFTALGTDDAVLTVSADSGEQLQVLVSDEELLRYATYFPVYVNNLIRHRTLGQGADRDVQVHATAEPLSFEIREDMYAQKVLLGIEYPKDMKSFWSLKVEAARNIGRALIDRADKVTRNTRVAERREQ